MEDRDHLIMDVIGPAHYPVHVPLIILKVLEAGTALDLTLLSQDNTKITQFLLGEGT